MKILNFGSLNLDFVYNVEHFVRSGETISSLKREVFCGGKGLNQSIALAKSGAEVYHAGAVGVQDGNMLLEVLRNVGVNTDYIEQKNNISSGHAIIQVDSNGQNCILLFGGANQCITREQIDKTINNFSKGDYLILQNEINLLDYIIDTALQKGMRIVLNPSPFHKKITNLPIELLDTLILNEIEAEDICGKGTPEENLKKLNNQYPNVKIVLTMGEDGVYYCNKNKLIKNGVYSVNVVDTTAAGDTFTGFFIGCLSQGKEPEEALKLASMASAISVSRKGAGASIPNMNEILESHLELRG